MSMAHDEKGFFSAGWDGSALVSSATHHFRKFVPLKTFLELGSEHWSICPEFRRTRLSTDSNRRPTPQPTFRPIGR